MAKELKVFREVPYPLGTLIRQIELGIIGLPDLQRPFVWPDTKVRDLFDSLYKGYPVGYFLFWANANVGGHKGIGTDHKQKHPDLLIVDGQQRLTSLYAVMKGQEVIRENYDKATIRIAFNPLEEKFEVPDASIQKNPRYIQNISVLWQPDTYLDEVMDEYIERLKSSVELSRDDIRRIKRIINDLKNLENYTFSALELSHTISEEQVADVFVRINSQGKKLNQADFILTLMSVFWEDGDASWKNFADSADCPVETHPPRITTSLSPIRISCYGYPLA
ncbi:DUF262 domain-containing protein [Siphonobacter sp. SORGH_AS_0500]|uniref:DUF262 domain-containing protein n=1 Tax=Siphonobacter sp. SORGH_AS_0500 TaxID=1864824 RepID=UPI0018E34B2F|nr:DUF262 domain-containing protein [Siphonobacter sp. SORGH_AS_0500]